MNNSITNYTTLMNTTSKWIIRLLVSLEFIPTNVSLPRHDGLFRDIHFRRSLELEANDSPKNSYCTNS